MPYVRERFRNVLARPTCTLAANIFDPLSTRIAHMLGYEVCVLSGSVGKVATLAAPDSVLANMSDVVESEVRPATTSSIPRALHESEISLMTALVIS